ncbi:MAG: hypothetical protein HUN04_25475 [Desulfobacter sp.]|nr:MAG: hypothetical protein HUN04_25475 [Desulfobacter sp.]
MILYGKWKAKFTGKRCLIFLGVWFIISFILYLGIHLAETRQKQRLIKTGVAISKDISSQSGLPLLEKKFDLLSQRIENIKQKPEVIFASIIDHKNKLIAYTDQDQFFTLNRDQSGEQDGVIYWKISNTNNKKIMNFSSDITFSGTRVGEVFISLAANGIGFIRKIFFMVAAMGVLAIFISFGLVRYQDFLAWWKSKAYSVSAPGEPEINSEEGARFFCPMCSRQSSFSQRICSGEKLEDFPVIQNYSREYKEVLLENLNTVEELEWLKRRIIARSAKIITKLETEQ